VNILSHATQLKHAKRKFKKRWKIQYEIKGWKSSQESNQFKSIIHQTDKTPRRRAPNIYYVKKKGYRKGYSVIER
jgi:hypothetical protein